MAKKSKSAKKNYFVAFSSIISGGLVYLWFALSALVASVSSIIGGSSTSTNGYDLLSTSAESDGVTMFKIFGIASLVVAGVLVVLGVMQLLNNMKTIKFNCAKLLKIVMLALLVCAVMCIIALFVAIGDTGFSIGGLVSASYSVGAGMWVFASVSLVSFVANLLVK